MVRVAARRPDEAEAIAVIEIYRFAGFDVDEIVIGDVIFRLLDMEFPVVGISAARQEKIRVMRTGIHDKLTAECIDIVMFDIVPE